MALFGFLGGKKTSVGLDIGSGIIKLVVIDHSGSEPELAKVATTEVAADAIVEGEVMDPGIVAEAIRGLFSAAGVKQRSVVTAVGGRDVIVKKIQMDRMKEGDAREVIRWEAEQHVPLDIANVELDFQILDPDAEGLEMNVLLVAAKRELVDSRTSLLGEAGLEAAIIDVDAFAIHNAFELNHPDAMQGVVGLVNIGHEVTNVNILEDGVPVLTRDLSVGTRRFREDLQREKGLSAEDSERLIQGQAQSGDLAQYVDARAEEIAVGVERAAAFLATASRSAGGLGRVYTIGGGARVPGLNEALSNRLRVPVELASPVQRLKVRDSVFESVAVDEVAPLLMLSVGLALRRARPTDSIKRGATSSTATDSNTESRTLSRCTGLASSTGTRSRFDNASFRPGTRAPPPMVYTRPRPPADRDAVARNAAARSTPTAISSARASTYCARSPLCAWPWMSRSESSAESPFSRCRSSRNRRVPTDRSRVSTGTPSSRMFTLVTSCPMLTSPTTPCMASGWFNSKALWIANASTSMIPGSSPASLRSEVRLSTSSRFAATSSTFICSPSASGSRIWKSSPTFAMSKGTCCSASHRITSRASPSFIRSIWIFLTITSRPPTAVTTDRCLTPAVENSPRIASDTSPGSMTSPSTMASAATSVVATLASSGSLPEWSITASLMMPEPISRPTEVFLPPSNPKRAIGAYGLKKKRGRGQTTVSPAPYPVKPRTYLRPNQQVLWLPRVRPL